MRGILCNFYANLMRRCNVLCRFNASPASDTHESGSRSKSKERGVGSQAEIRVGQ